MTIADYSNLLIIADDFTGANDTGVQLTKKGAKVDVYFDWENDFIKKSADIIVVNTDSRSLKKEYAQERIKKIIRKNNINRPIYKKIDSTFRGNIGAEIETLLIESEYQAALVIPAFPDMKRTIINGICYVDNIELIKTEFASDPKTPIHSSKISHCLSQQTNLLSTEIHLDIIRNNLLVDSVESSIKKGVKLFIIDSQTNDDLQLIIKQMLTINCKILLAGSAGLISYLPTNYTTPTLKTTFKCNHNNKMLVISGSMSEVTRQQINHAATFAHLWQVIDININDLLPTFTPFQLKKYCILIKQVFENNKNCIIRTCRNDTERFLIESYCQKYHLTRKALGEYICQCLGKITQNISVENLFLTGGDVAISIAKSLGAIGFHIEGEASPGIPYGTLIGDNQKNYRIFTKAGGFGELNIFTKSLELI